MPAITTASLWQIIAWATPNIVEWETQCRKTTTTISCPAATTWVWVCNVLVVPVRVAPGQLSSLPEIKCKDSNNNNIHNNKALTLLVLMARPEMRLVVASPETVPPGPTPGLVAMPTRMDSTMLNSHRVLDQSFTTVETRTWVIRIE